MNILTTKAVEDNLSRERWKYLYHKTPPNYQELRAIGQKEYGYLKKYVESKSGKFLEIGCGMGACALEVAQKKGWKTYGIDYCLDNLIGARKFWKYFKAKPNLIYGNINKMPHKDNFFDLLYGSGVLEHVYDTQEAINETFRVLKQGGVSINTVPVFSLASLTFRQLSGTIPDLPVLKQIYEFIHIKILKRRFMHTGYEKCFARRSLIKMYKKAGFKNITVSHDKRFRLYLKNFHPILKRIITKLEKNKLFWAWYVVVARK